MQSCGCEARHDGGALGRNECHSAWQVAAPSWVDLVAENASAMLGEIETIDSGKLAKETRAQSGYVADYYYYFAGLADKIQGATLPIRQTRHARLHQTCAHRRGGCRGSLEREEMFLTATKLGPALAAGNTVVLKASEMAPAPMFEFARIVEQARFSAGRGECHHRLRRTLRAFIDQPSRRCARCAFTGPGPRNGIVTLYDNTRREFRRGVNWSWEESHGHPGHLTMPIWKVPSMASSPVISALPGRAVWLGRGCLFSPAFASRFSINWWNALRSDLHW